MSGLLPSLVSEGGAMRTLLSAASAAELAWPLMSVNSQRWKPGKGRKWGVSPTKNVFGTSPGKNRGLRVYDGQRVPAGKLLISQFHPKVFPGWNVSTLFFSYKKIVYKKIEAQFGQNLRKC